ncbi:MAG TPA: ATP-binding protein [Spirochaetota bacterium]|nr:ATP-binding protein [Spirochaetota bacterium]
MTVKTNNFIKSKRFIDETIERRGFAAVLGEKGSGKTHIIREIIGAKEEKQDKYSVIRITPMRENEKCITQIMSAMIEDVSGETLRRDTEARRRQLRRVLGDATTTVILVIDEAQDLHKSSLRGLKKIHELGWGMKDRLFSIIMFGQLSLKDKIADDELRPRIKRLQLAELTQKEKEEFIPAPQIFSEKALAIFLKRTRKTPLGVLAAFEQLDQIRLDLDRRKIDEQMVADFFSLDKREAIIALDKSYRQMSREIKSLTGEDVSPTALNQFTNGSYKGNTDRIDRLMETYLEKEKTMRAAQ